MSKRNVAVVLLPVLVLAAVFLYLVSSTGGGDSETSSQGVEALDGQPREREGLVDRQVELKAPPVHAPPAMAEEDPESEDSVAATDPRESLDVQQAPAPQAKAKKERRERTPEEEAERQLQKMAREEEKARKEGAKLVERLGLEAWQGDEIANLKIMEKRRKVELEDQKKSGALTKDEFKALEKELKEQTKLAIESMLSAEQLELYQQKKGGAGGKDKGAGVPKDKG